MPELATGWVTIVADTSRIPGQIRQAFGQTDRIAQQQGRQAGRSFSGAVGSSLKSFAGIAGVAGGFATIGAAVNSAMRSGLDFTNALNTMQAVAGASAQQVAEVGRAARELGTDSQLAATSSTDAANAMLELAKGGFTVQQSMQAARGTLQLAAAAQISAADAATIQSQALQAFGKNADYAGKTADILANAANASSAEITDVAQALQQSGTVANQFGLSMSDTAASIALLANAGIKGSDAGTLLKSTLLALTDQSDQAETVMKQLGLTVYDSSGRFVGMEALFGQLNAASERMTDQQYQQATAILFGSDAMRLSGLAAQVGADGFTQMRAAMEKNGSAAEVAAAKMQGLPGAWERLKNSAQDAGLAFYDAVDGPLTAAANMASDVLGDLVGDAQGAGEDIRNAFADDRVQSFIASVRDNGTSAFDGIVQAATGLGAALAPSLEAAAMIAGALGVSTWTVFLEVVRAASGVLEGLTPVLSTVATMVGNNAGLATALVGAFLAWRLIPPVMGRVQSALSPVTTALGNARTSAQNFISTNTAMAQGLASNRTLMMQMAGVVQTANGRWQTLSGQALTTAQAMQRMNSVAASGVTQFGRFGSAISQIGNHVPVVTRMQAAFVNTAISANQFGRTLGTLNAGMTGFRAGGSALLGAFGGPLGAAVTGAIAYLGLAASAHAENTQKARAQSQAVKDLAASEVALGSALSQSRGAMSQDVWGKAGEQIAAYQQTLKTTSAQHKSTWDQLKEIGGIGKLLVGSNDELNQNAERSMAAQKAMTDLKMTNDDLVRSLYGSDGQWKTTADRLAAMGQGGAKAAGELSRMRSEFVQQRDIAGRITPGVSELGDAIRLMGDNGASASDKLNALKTAMDAMNPARNKTEAMAQYGDTIRKAAEAAAGIDASAFRGGKLDELSESGAALGRTLDELAEKSAQVASTGGDMGAVVARNEEVFRQLAIATGQPIEKIRELYAELGGTAVDLAVQLKGAPEVTQQLAAISAQWNSVPEQKSLEVRESAVNDETRAALERMKIQVSEPKNGVVTITANDADARAKILLITQNVSVLNALKANPQIDLNTAVFQARNSEAIAALQGLDRADVSPAAGLIIDDLLAGKQVSMEQLNILSQSSANPAVNLLIDQLLKNAAIANKALDDVARKRNAQIQVDFISGLNADTAPLNNPQQFGSNFDRNLQELGRRQQQGYADGGIRRYAQGGIAKLEKYANGGHLTEPRVLPGRGAGSVFTTAAGPAIAAEGETSAESWIPWAQSKRTRATGILADTARAFGYMLVPQDQVPSSLSALLGAITAGGAKRWLQAAGVDGVNRFADGGIRAEDFRRLADGQGASRPLTGAPYNWGGVNWGDCSGAMSAFARLAAGLPPFGGRFSTATMGEQIQAMGGMLGRGGSGDMRFGWVNGGPGGGHTAGTLPDGTNVEMGGSYGGGMVGGSVGADDPQFTEHAFFPVGPSWNNPETGVPGDQGGWVQRPDGTWVQTGQTGGFGASGSTGGGGEDKSLSGRLGNAASAFVSGQVTDLFNVLSINDQPGVLAAITEYENQQRQLQQQYERGMDGGNGQKQNGRYLKVKSVPEAEEDVVNARADLDLAKQRKTELKPDAKESERMSRQNQLTKAEQRLRDAEADLEEAKANPTGRKFVPNPSNPGQPGGAPIQDPGFQRPAPGQDLGGAGAGAGAPGAGAVPGPSQVKDAFRVGLREAWRQGPPWSATDWIIQKESSWDPNARNGKYFSLGQLGPEAWAAAGVAPTTDPMQNGQAYDHYVGGRYGDPLRAKEHHEANNWYDDGGIGRGIGDMQKRILEPERVLSPRQTTAFEEMVRRNFQPAQGGSDAVVAKLDQLIRLIAEDSGGDAYLIRDSEGTRRAEKVQKKKISTKLGSW
ncbi:tape measure protein [Gordonia phage Pytheas]|nr:tape measure protein [Gordonia Phage Jablanski]UYL88046.1 tape measure protein [Gordonia phage Pytheas]